MKLFLSYSHADIVWAREFSEYLSGQDISVWRDTERMEFGQILTREVTTAIEDSDGYCILITKQSMDSWWVNAELSAAFSRRASNPSYHLIPILLEDDCLPNLLTGLLYLDGRSRGPESVAKDVAATLLGHGQSNGDLDLWEQVLRGIEKDQFTEEPSSMKYGGWSKSYSISYLPIAFPERLLDSVSSDDSVTVTHWVMRGLLSLRRMLRKSNVKSSLLPRVDKCLTLGRQYLLRHFDGQGAGLFRATTTGISISRDVRHSATFAKALLQLSHERLEPIQKAIAYSLEDLSEGDGRPPTLAERLHLVGLLWSRPYLRANWMSDSFLMETQAKLEDSLMSVAFPCEVKGARAKLFGEEDRWWMAGYYTWWVLDACGEMLLTSSRRVCQDTIPDILKGLHGLAFTSGEQVSFPLTIDGTPDLGTTAHIGEILLRLWPAEHMQWLSGLEKYLTESISSNGLDSYTHTEFLWAIPHFYERLGALKEEIGQL